MAQLMSAEKDLSAAAKMRHDMVVDSYERLEHFAFRLQSIHNFKNDEMILVCIKVDSRWRTIVDVLMPDMNWQPIRDSGLEPVARGSAKFSLCLLIAEEFPNIRDVILEKPGDGYYKCIALDEGGATVYDIKPKEQKA